jgi:proline iminopeptidase
MRVRLRDGLRIFVDCDGANLRPDGPRMRAVPTLILLHGGPGFDHTSFKSFFARFADRCQIVYYDHRGMGRSDAGSQAQWNLDTWADDLADLIDILGLDRPILLGQSFGGFVALRYAIRHSAKLGGLVLSSTAARHVPEDCLAAFNRLGGEEAGRAAEAFFVAPSAQTFAPYQQLCLPLYNTTPQDAQIRERTILTPEVLFSFWRGEHRGYDLRNELGSIFSPTLIVVGEEDPITPVARSIEIADALEPRLAQLEISPDAGHGVYRDLPDHFDDLLDGFLSSIQ